MQANASQERARTFKLHIRNRLEPIVHLGVCRIMLRLPDSASLKDKRQVSRSLTARIRNTFNVAVAEVAAANFGNLLCEHRPGPRQRDGLQGGRVRRRV